MTDQDILKIAADAGLKINTGNGAIRFARALLAAQPAQVAPSRDEIIAAMDEAQAKLNACYRCKGDWVPLRHYNIADAVLVLLATHAAVPAPVQAGEPKSGLQHLVDAWLVSADDENSQGYVNVAAAMRTCAADLLRSMKMSASPPMGSQESAMGSKPHPDQPLVFDSQGTVRFRENKLVSHLVDWAGPRGMGLNELVAHAREHDLADDEYAQLAQLIGYSVSGWGTLSFASDEAVERNDARAAAMLATKQEQG